MRAITLVKRYEFEFAGNVVKNALILGDVDNDGSNELVVGNQNGDLCIFKVIFICIYILNILKTVWKYNEICMWLLVGSRKNTTYFQIRAN